MATIIIKATLIVITSIIIKDIMMIVDIIQEIKGITILRVDIQESIGTTRYQGQNRVRMKEGIKIIQRVTMIRMIKVTSKVCLDNSVSYIYNIFDIYIM